jgi:hypothetical protein
MSADDAAIEAEFPTHPLAPDGLASNILSQRVGIFRVPDSRIYIATRAAAARVEAEMPTAAVLNVAMAPMEGACNDWHINELDPDLKVRTAYVFLQGAVSALELMLSATRTPHGCDRVVVACEWGTNRSVAVALVWMLKHSLKHSGFERTLKGFCAKLQELVLEPKKRAAEHYNLKIRGKHMWPTLVITGRFKNSSKALLAAAMACVRVEHARPLDPVRLVVQRVRSDQPDHPYADEQGHVTWRDFCYADYAELVAQNMSGEARMARQHMQPDLDGSYWPIELNYKNPTRPTPGTKRARVD